MAAKQVIIIYYIYVAVYIVWCYFTSIFFNLMSMRTAEILETCALAILTRPEINE